ncbi:hypothetical protein SAJA_12655 [Salinisphaera japonica YTM-1]|uniref:Uncharacterized protein n=1 Tax=Salinisphaera japonica YTM-1 TaxID=1209778 RepID=A0A423PJ90_9GAMM|nr:hypothetical protein SAJA_12655 [Salinisphaera japonica YTM-1]
MSTRVTGAHHMSNYIVGKAFTLQSRSKGLGFRKPKRRYPEKMPAAVFWPERLGIVNI